MRTEGSDGHHPELLAVLARHRPAATHREVWGDGTLPLEFSAYLTRARVPNELVTSVRCIVTAPGGIVVCENRNEQHVWPGGRRETGESMTEAVVREVAEETAWQLDPQTLTHLGFLHLAHLGPRPAGYAYPYPDGVQLILTRASSHQSRSRFSAHTSRDAERRSPPNLAMPG